MVRIEDAWTQKVSGGASQVGGQRSFGYSIKEANLLGLRKDLAVSHERITERFTDTPLHHGRQFFGSSWILASQYKTPSDGRTRAVEIGRPSRGLDTPWSTSMNGGSADSLASIYNLLLMEGKSGGRREPGGWRDALVSGSFTAYHHGMPYLTECGAAQTWRWAVSTASGI